MSEDLRPNPLADQLEPPADSLRPQPSRLAERENIETAALHELTGLSIVGAKQFTREQVEALCRFAAWLETIEIAPFHPLDGKIVISAFFEPSTRTRTSFESAVLRLDGKTISITDGHTTGEAKGESPGRHRRDVQRLRRPSSSSATPRPPPSTSCAAACGSR